MRLANMGVRMTKVKLLLAIGLGSSLSAICAPAFAQYGHQGAYAPVLGATDPCVLGTNGQPGSCVGPMRVAPMIMSQGNVQLQPTNAPQPVYAPEQNYAPPIMVASQQMSPAISGCVQGYNGPTIPCSGVWVPAPNYTPQQPIMQAPSQYMPAPIMYAPQPQQVNMIPTSFFTGGITYGAGFPTDTTYSYGGGGYAYSSGGTRFSGVRERSPTPLVAPPRRPRHAPPPPHHH